MGLRGLFCLAIGFVEREEMRPHWRFRIGCCVESCFGGLFGVLVLVLVSLDSMLSVSRLIIRLSACKVAVAVGNQYTYPLSK